MRKYLLTYWTEYNDEMTDFEIEIEADSIQDALDKFKAMRKTHKRITKIEEI